jgi:hypothetical protein
VPNQRIGRNAAPPAYGEYPSLSPPPLAAPAVLSYLSLAPRPSTGLDALKPMSPLVPSSVDPQVAMSSEWDCEWERCKRLAGNDAPTPVGPSGTFKPGTMEGFWEGLFTVSSSSSLRFASTVLVEHRLHVKPSPFGGAKHIVHRIHGIRGVTVRRPPADAEQEPGCAAQSDLALARIPPLVARGRGRVGRCGRSARAPAIQAAIPRGLIARVPPTWLSRRTRPRERRHTGA